MTQKELKLTLEVDTPGNTLAIAVGNGSPNQNFVAANRIFAAVFPDIHNPRQLFALSKSEGGNKTILQYNEGFWELLTLKMNQDTIFYLLKNISYEKLVLKQVRLQLKELTDTYGFYAEILEKELPIGVLIIDDNYDVSYANHTLKRFFHIPAKVRLEKCYNYLKEIKPCHGCLLKGFRKDKQKSKKTFEVEGGEHLVTAEIHPVGDKYIIIFRDTTREIKLIKEIKKQQQKLESANKMIAAQNDILKGLSTINIRIGQMRDPEAILETMIHAIIDIFSCEKGAILLFNEAGKIKDAHFTASIKESERDIIIKSIETSIEKTVRGGEQNIEDSPGDAPGEEDRKNLANYTIQEMFHKKKLIGRIFLYKPGKVIDQPVLELFLNQVSVYLENLELQRKLEEVAQTDALTGVFNRYYFQKQFKEEIELSQRFGQPLSLILIDLNGLKVLNDSDGHGAGDQFLRETARFLRDHVSSFDSIYRVGGDEFIILLANCPANHLNIMEEMLKEIQAIASFQYNGKTFPISFCLGGACSTEVGHRRLEEEADHRMYQDKEKYYKMHKKYR